METSTSQQITVCGILERFPLDFIPDIKQSDRELVLNCVKAYKNLEKDTLPGSFNFLDPREISIISEYFARYGPQIRFVIFSSYAGHLRLVKKINVTLQMCKISHLNNRSYKSINTANE